MESLLIESLKKEEFTFPCLHRLQERFGLSQKRDKDRGKIERGSVWRKTQADVRFLLPKLPFFEGGRAETASWHFQLSNENNMFVWEKNNKTPVHASTVALFVPTAGLLKCTVCCTLC